MGEKLPILDKESVTKEQVIEGLKNHGPESEEARALVGAWLDGEEARITKERTEAHEKGEPYDDARVNNERSIHCAMMYYRAGHREVALDMLKDAREDAYNRQDTELYEEIVELEYKVEGGEL